MSNYNLNMDTEAVISLVSSIRDKANHMILTLLKERGVEDIAPAYGGIFINLFRYRELRMGEIAKKLERDKSTVTALINRLLNLGYIKTRKDDSDHRMTLVRLTEKGLVLEKDFFEISDLLIKRVYQGFSEEEKNCLVRLLSRINHNLEP